MEKEKKILYVATVQSHIGQFHMPIIKRLQEVGYVVEVAAKNNLKDKDNLNIDCVDKIFDIDFSRFPFSRRNIKAYKLLKNIINQNNYHTIICNTPVGGVIARLASKKARKLGTKVVYIAHGFHFFKGAKIKNWLIYYPIEKIMAKYTDVLFTINKQDFALAQKKMKAKKVLYIPGLGIDENRFIGIGHDKEKSRQLLDMSNEDFIIFSVGELNDNKNHKVVIEAISKLKECNIKYYIAGIGPNKNKLKEQASLLGMPENVQLVGYRRDIGNFYSACDVFCFPSKREGLSFALMEAMSFEKPVICSDIRGNVDLIEPQKGGFLCEDNYKNYANAISILMNNAQLAKEMGEYNGEKIKSFSSEVVQDIMVDMLNSFDQGKNS